MPPLILPDDEYNRTLVRNVHPSAWVNPEPASHYNIVVIGAGTAGLVTAAGAAGLGAKVALVERHLLGGDCLNFGCVPSKGMIRASRAARDIRAAAGDDGITVGGAVDIDFGKVMERVRRIRSDLSVHDSVERFSRELGVDVFLGPGAFTGPGRIDVAGRILRFKKAAICTGARPAVPLIPGIEETGYLTHETVFGLTELPRRLLVIGGGPIGCELSQAFARLGSGVTLIHTSGHLLNREDPDAAEIVQRVLLRDGVQLVLDAKPLKAEQRGEEKVLTVEKSKQVLEFPCDAILAGVGRTPNVEGLGLEAAGVEYGTRSGVRVNDRLQTTNPDVYAAGDVCSAFKFTHAAEAMARIVIANALFKARQKVSALVIPWCTYTDPEVARIGMNEQEAQGRGIDVLTLTVPLSENDRARIDGETEGFARIHLKRGTDRILGATIVARRAGEMVGEISLAMTAGLGLSAIGRTIHPYPTLSEAIRRLADQHNKSRLTPAVRKLFSAWLKWQRS